MTRMRLHHDNIGLAGRLKVLARQQHSITQTQLPKEIPQGHGHY